MSFAMKAVNGGDFANPSPGTVGAVCTRIIDMGTQESQWGPKRRVLLSFEIDEEMSDGRRFIVSSSYTLSFHEKSALRQALEAWRGKTFAEGEEFDLGAVLGKPALLNLVESDKGYTNIKSISPLPKGMPALEPDGEVLAFNLDAPDWDAFNDLSERLQEKIQASPEYQKAMGKAKSSAAEERVAKPASSRVKMESAPKSEPAEPLPADFDDEIPF